MKDNVEDKELEEARQFAYGYNLEYQDIHGVDCPTIDSIADLALAYHQYREEKKWVSVKERLPEVGKEKVNQIIIKSKYGVETFEVESEKDIRFLLKDCGMTHWQPLPKE